MWLDLVIFECGFRILNHCSVPICIVAISRDHHDFFQYCTFVELFRMLSCVFSNAKMFAVLSIYGPVTTLQSEPVRSVTVRQLCYQKSTLLR